MVRIPDWELLEGTDIVLVLFLASWLQVLPGT